MVLHRIETVLSKILDKVPFFQAKGIRRRWLLNSVSFLVVLLAVMVVAFSAVIRSYYDGDILTDVEGRATTASKTSSSRRAADSTLSPWMAFSSSSISICSSSIWA